MQKHKNVPSILLFTILIIGGLSTKLLGQPKITVGRISFEGNTKYSDIELKELVAVKEGQSYSKEELDSTIWTPRFDQKNMDISSKYMNNGHLMFSMDIQKVENGKTTNVILEIHEGSVFKIDKVSIMGNQSVKNEEIVTLLEVRTGEPFSRQLLIDTQRSLASTGYFDPEKIIVRPKPNVEEYTVDIIFEVTEI